MTAVSVEELEEALARYEEALEVKGKAELVEWDQWYRGELRKVVRQRLRTDKGAFLTHEEMVKLIKWKLRRGKFRPALEGYVRSNADTLVFTSTNAALTLLFDKASEAEAERSLDEDTIKSAMKAACQMKGVGPGLSSAILALAVPRFLPYMSDELFTFGAGTSTTPKYTEKEYVSLFDKITKRLSKESRGKKGEKSFACVQDVEQFEKAAWAYGVLSSKGLLEADRKRAIDDDGAAKEVTMKRRRKS